MTDSLFKLIEGLEHARSAWEADDVADVLWLAAWMQLQSPPAAAEPPSEEEPAAEDVAPITPPVDETTSQPFSDFALSDFAPTDEQEMAEKDEAAQVPTETPAANLHLPAGISSGADLSGRSLRAPSAAALPAKLKLARSLRPLMRRVPSRTEWSFDEQETVERIAGGDVWWPALRPAEVARFCVALVVDESVSMTVWQQTARELYRLLAWTGAFPIIRTYRLRADGQVTIVYRRRENDGGAVALRSQLAQPGLASLVLVLSDCVSPGWREGMAFSLLEQWSHSALTCLIQTLPEVMWRRTALGVMPRIRLMNRAMADSNVRLEAVAKDPLLVDELPIGWRLPIANLDPEGIAALASLLAGGTSKSCAGVIVTPPSPPLARGGKAQPLTVEQRVHYFWENASPTARRLAELVAVSPVVSLQVVRLIRRAMLPEARQTHEAEFLLGGLVHAVHDDNEAWHAARNDVNLRFYDGVADLLLDATPASDWLEVLDAVSRYVETRLGRRLDGFRALLPDPTAAADGTPIENEPFVHIAVSRLARLGGNYARLAELAQAPATSRWVTAAGTDSTGTATEPPIEQRGEIVFEPDPWTTEELKLGRSYATRPKEQLGEQPLPPLLIRNTGRGPVRLRKPTIASSTPDGASHCVAVDWAAPESPSAEIPDESYLELQPNATYDLLLRVDLAAWKQDSLRPERTRRAVIEIRDSWDHCWTLEIQLPVESPLPPRPQPVSHGDEYRLRGTLAVDFNERLYECTPTLFIGLGGTGYEVLMRLRQRIFAELGRPPQEFLGFLALDTNDPRGTYRTAEPFASHADLALETWPEFVDCSISESAFRNAFSVLKHGQDRGLGWLHPELEMYGSSIMGSGTGTHRQLGRLAFMLRHAEIRSRIVDQIKRVAAVAVGSPSTELGDRSVRIATDRVEVVIITSLAGGTGSGMFLDVAYLVRDVLQNDSRFNYRIQSYSTLISVLPDVFSAFGPPQLVSRFRQNAYAALREMEYYSAARAETLGFDSDSRGAHGRQRPLIGYPAPWKSRSDRDAVIAGTPWDMCYLVGAAGARNPGLPQSAADTNEMIADYLFLDIAPYELSISKRSTRSNMYQITDRVVAATVKEDDFDRADSRPDRDALPRAVNDESDGRAVYEESYGCGYGSFGVAEILVDRQRILRCAGYRLAETLIRNRWLGDRGRYSAATYGAWTRKDLFSSDAVDVPTDSISYHPTDLMRELFRRHDALGQPVRGGESPSDTLDPATDDFSGGNSGDDARQSRFPSSSRAPPPPSTESKTGVQGELGRSSRTRAPLDWLEYFRQGLERVIQTDSLKAAPLRRFLTRVLSTLGHLRPEDLSGVDERESLAIGTLDKRSAELGGSSTQLGPLRSRLFALVRRRSEEVGVDPVLELLQHYNKFFAEGAQYISREHRKETVTLQDILGRLERAESAFFPIRVFLLRRRCDEAHELARKALPKWCAHAAAPYIESLYDSLSSCVGSRSDAIPPEFGQWRTLQQQYANTKLVLKRLADHMRRQFEQFSRPESTDRKQILMPDGAPEHYDAEIAQALERHPDIAAGKGRETFDAKHLEPLVLKHLGDERSEAPKSFGEFLDSRLSGDSSESDQKLADVGEILATACQRVLERHLDLSRLIQGSVIDYLVSLSDGERRHQLKRFVTSCGPSCHARLSRDAKVQPVHRNVLGRSARVAGQSTSHVAQLDAEIRSLARESDTTDGFEIDEIADTAPHHFVLVRETAGYPLNFSGELEELRTAYYEALHDGPAGMCHLDYRLGDLDLPDLTPTSHGELASIREHISLVLAAFVLGEIRADGSTFVVRVRDETEFGSYVVRLGSRMERIIKNACRNPRLLDYLTNWWHRWRDSASVRRWAVLRCAAQLTMEMLPQRFPLWNAYAQLLRETDRELRAHAEGAGWLTLLSELDRMYPDDEHSRAVHGRAVNEIRKKCLVSASSALPLYQVDDRAIDTLSELYGEPPGASSP